MANDSKPSSWPDLLIQLRWPVVVLTIFLAGLYLAWQVYREPFDRVGQAGRAMGDAADAAVERAEAVARAFFSGNITEQFLSSIPEVDSQRGGLLEVAQIEVVESFTRTDERRALWDLLYLGTTVAEIKVPVTYRYHLRFDQPWRVEATGNVCVVYAPRIQPTQPPAIHTEGLQRRVEEGWLRFDAEEQLSALQDTMTPRLRQMAGDPRHIGLIRETARQTVAEFIRAWLLREDQWHQDHLTQIKVVFADETAERMMTLGPTLEFDEVPQTVP